jgi:hypothetical protein
MPKVASKNGRSTRIAGSTTKYDAHHSVLKQTYGALADLRRELADSKSKVAEREEVLRIFSTCADSQRAWLLLEDYFEKLSLSRKDFNTGEWWPRLLAEPAGGTGHALPPGQPSGAHGAEPVRQRRALRRD